MSDSTAVESKAAPILTSVGLPSDAKRIAGSSCPLFSFVAFAGAFLSSVYVLNNGPSPGPHTSNARRSINIVHEITSRFLLRYVLSRGNLRFRDLGLHCLCATWDWVHSLAGASYAMYAMGHALTHFLHNAIFSSPARNLTARDFFAHPAVLFVPFSIVNPFFEELIARAYPMTEVKDLTGSSALAVLISDAVQSSYHLCYGWEGAIALSFLFLTFALYYPRSRRAVPLIVARGFFDICALVRLW
jgi:membrane protease YdiL (CAAX protease family)